MTQQAKHTPGPWHVEPMRARGKYAGCIQVVPEAGPAHVFLGQGRDDIQMANARLIAAAPELLAALKDTLEYIVGYAESADSDDPCHEMLKRWQALVAKAEGR